MSPEAGASDLQAVARLKAARERILAELHKVIVGQDAVIEQMLIALFADGHVLLVGVPGLAKTLLVSSLARVLDLRFSRIQFTPDLMPSDITGTDIIEEDHATGQRSFRFLRGPVFANIVLADEINRTPPKTQAALLQAMQEKEVTTGGQTFPLALPFFVLATQNPIELEGTYPLPEAQLDRFMFKLKVPFPARESLRALLDVSLDREPADSLAAVAGPEDVLRIAAVCRSTLLAERCKQAAVSLVLATQPDVGEESAAARRHLRYGASPRALQSLVRAARVRAVMAGRSHVDIADLEAVAAPVLRHRILLRLESELDGLDADTVLESVLDEWRSRT